MRHALRQLLACVRLENKGQIQDNLKGQRRHTLVFQTTSEVPQHHPCIDKGHNEKEDGDYSCSNVRNE